MSSPYIEIWVYARPDRSLTIEERHARFVEKMQRIGPPLGFVGLEPPPTPEQGDYVSVFSVKYPIRGLKCFGDYEQRHEKYIWKDHGSYDEHLRYRFIISNKAIDYDYVIKQNLPPIVEAFDAYRCFVDFDSYAYRYIKGPEPEPGQPYEFNALYKAVNAATGGGVDGRGNILSLYPAQFWDGELCRRALGFDRDEVIRRLKDVAIVAQPLMDGVYLVLNDQRDLSYDTYVAMVETIRPMLGLNYERLL